MQLQTKSILRASLLALTVFSMGVSARGGTVWTGPTTTFINGGGDPTLPANQDRLTANVWITRGGFQGIYNAKTELVFTSLLSPADTEWADGTTANTNLTYTNWNAWAKFTHLGPPSTVGVNAVMHLKTDDIYVDVTFTSWTSMSGGFSYQRSTPSVSITNPVDGAVFFAPAVVTIAASASDVGGSVTNVEFFDGVTSLGSDPSRPYSVTVPLTVGIHALTAVSSDILGATKTSPIVQVTVVSNTFPTVAITSPPDNTSFTVPAVVPIIATAQDSDGVVTNVAFFDGGTFLGGTNNT
ncbi:MAG: Ig-like domain-containing protein, partial [Bryobacteraceae bacterium]